MDAQEIDKLAGANAIKPRISLAYLEGEIEQIWYTTADRCISERATLRAAEGLKVMTLCFILMKNGFISVGDSTPASPENFNPDLGRKLAYDQALRKLWPILGYELRTRLMRDAEMGQPHRGHQS